MSLSLQDLSARNEIVDLTVRYARTMDVRDWPGLRAVFADRVYVDFQQATGAAPGELPAEAVVAALHALLEREGLVVQTLTSNHLVELAGDRARGVVDYHVIHHAADGDELGLRGRYDFGLHQQNGTWCIDRLVVGVSWSYGSPAVLGLTCGCCPTPASSER